MSNHRLLNYLGKHQANLELKWMKQAISSQPSLPCLELMVQRRLLGEPLQYILGTTPFGPLNLLTRSPVLIPRPETENWTMKLADYAKQVLRPSPSKPISLLDLGTGSGCIPLLLLHLWPKGSARVTAADISADAVALATENAIQCDVDQRTFTVVLADYTAPSFSVSDTPFHVITSNPPYISAAQYQELPESVRNHEDRRALLGGTDGLDFYHIIARLIARRGFMAEGAIVALEVGDGQAESVEQIMQVHGKLKDTAVWLDPWEKRRVVVGRSIEPQ